MAEDFVAVTADERARESIINDIDKNLFVEAGAGSGKTTMLVNRMVAMIEKGIPVDKICAITFTKNAALEFYERFQTLLIKRSSLADCKGKRFAGDLDKPNELTAKRCLAALADIDLCFMGTIDSFCNMILSEHPTEAGIPSNTSLVNEKEELQLYRNFYLALLGGKYGDELREQAIYFNQLFRNSEEAFVILFKELMARRNVAFNYTKTALEDVDQKFKEARAGMLRIMAAFERDLSYLTNKKGDAQVIYRANAVTIKRRWSGNLNKVENALGKLAELSYGLEPGALGLDKEAYVRKNGETTVFNINDEDSSSALIRQIREYKYNGVLTFAFSCIEVLEAELKRQGKFTFFDYLYYLRNALVVDSQRGGRLIDHIYGRHSYFLIDEFQDTNPLQAEIFFHLAAENVAEEAYVNCIPRPGSLFIVGDPKQSIYRFRSADVSSYLRIRELFENKANCAVVQLVNNFRSRNVLKGYFNTVFSEMMPETTADQSAYRDIENLSSAEAVELEGLYSYSSYADDPSKEDSRQVAEMIKMLVANPAYQIQGRPITFADFMVITAGKEPIGRLTAVFDEEKIPVRVEGKVLFEECPSLRVLAELYHCLFDGDDVIALVAVLRGPLFGIAEAELAAYRSAWGRISLNSCSGNGTDRVGEALAKIAKLAGLINDYAPAAFVEVVIREFALFSYVSAERLEILYYVVELLRDGERSGAIVTHREALAYIDDLLNGEEKPERCLSLTKRADAVHIANLHKVKGLEAPIVILTKAGNKSPLPDLRVEYEDGVARGYLLALKQEITKTYKEELIATRAFKDKELAEKQSLDCERDRLVYVAATRARNVLIINNAYGKGGRRISNRWAKIFKCLQGDVFEQLDRSGYRFRVAEPGLVNAWELSEEKEIGFENLPTYSLMTPSKLKSGGVFERSDGGGAETFATLIGTMAHRMMEMIILSKDALAKEVLIENIMAEYLSADFLGERKVLTLKLELLFDRLHAGGFAQDSGVEADILPFLLSCEEVLCEIPFSYCEGGALWNGIIDLIYRKDGELHILDWKTNYDGEGLDAKYGEQLGAYIGAAERLLNERVVDAHTYHLDLAK